MDLLSAASAPRLHTQLLPDSIDLENSSLVNAIHITMPESIKKHLDIRGHHNVTFKNVGMGVTQFIAIDPDTQIRYAVSDPRKDGKPAAQF